VTARLARALRAHGVLVLAAILLAVLVLPLLSPVARAPQLTVENPLVYLVEVAVADGATLVPVGPVNRGTTVAFAGVADVGETWRFHFAYAGVDAGSLLLSRDALDAAGWRIVVPDDVGRRLREAGLAPSAG
jgi:hypothetical protein